MNMKSILNDTAQKVFQVTFSNNLCKFLAIFIEKVVYFDMKRQLKWIWWLFWQVTNDSLIWFELNGKTPLIFIIFIYSNNWNIFFLKFGHLFNWKKCVVQNTSGIFFLGIYFFLKFFSYDFLIGCYSIKISINNQLLFIPLILFGRIFDGKTVILIQTKYHTFLAILFFKFLCKIKKIQKDTNFQSSQSETTSLVSIQVHMKFNLSLKNHKKWHQKLDFGPI